MDGRADRVVAFLLDFDDDSPWWRTLIVFASTAAMGAAWMTAAMTIVWLFGGPTPWS